MVKETIVSPNYVDNMDSKLNVLFNHQTEVYEGEKGLIMI